MKQADAEWTQEVCAAWHWASTDAGHVEYTVIDWDLTEVGAEWTLVTGEEANSHMMRAPWETDANWAGSAENSADTRSVEH